MWLVKFPKFLSKLYSMIEKKIMRIMRNGRIETLNVMLVSSFGCYMPYFD